MKRSWPILRICPAFYLDVPRQRVKFSLLSRTRISFSANTLFSPCYFSPLLHMSRFSATVLLAATVTPRDTALPHPNNEKYSHYVATVYPYVFLKENFRASPTKFRSCVPVASNSGGAELPSCTSCTLWFGKALGRWSCVAGLSLPCYPSPLQVQSHSLLLTGNWLNCTLFQEVLIVVFRFVPFVGTGHLHTTVFWGPFSTTVLLTFVLNTE